MRNHLVYLLLAVWAVLLTDQASAQSPIKWSFSSKEAGDGMYDLVFSGKIDEGWFTYSQYLESDEGPLPTSFTYQEGPHFKLEGKNKESGEIIKVYDKVFGMTLTKFKHTAVFTQRVKVLDYSKPIVGYLSFMACNDEMCKPPIDVDFTFKLNPPADKPSDTPAKPEAAESKGDEQGAVTPSPSPEVDTQSTTVAPNTPADNQTNRPDDPNFKGFFDAKRDINSAQFVGNCSNEPIERDNSLLWVFIGGFLGGLLALLTPCVFPMIPLTVSFFTKRSANRSVGLRNALWYSASIVFIYVTIGIVLTMLFGPTILNEMSTNTWFNLVFFLIFVVFALSFFGLFEITLPASWVNKSDQMADKGGMIGIFFMAFTLALVSFSCTGPIVGTLLVETAKSNAGSALFGLIPARPLVGMFGFGLALALPFGLFAAFPGWLNSLPKSGGWMDNVKITLGFIELALALKFLSTADMVSHWGVLRFELFLAIWTVLALLLAVYQLGLLKLKGNKGRPGFGRLAVGLASLFFTFYLAYGLFNYRSLSLLSGIAPPVHYNFFKPFDCPHGLNCFHDFDEGLAEAKRTNKPLFVDFTGYGCVNCRKMEENVWHLPGIIEHLRENYVVVSLYVDDKERLFPDDKFFYLLDPRTGDKIRTVGDKWSAFQVNNFAVSAQPYYVLMHNDGKTILTPPSDYQKGKYPEVYKAFLDCGYEAFQRVKSANDTELMGAK